MDHSTPISESAGMLDFQKEVLVAELGGGVFVGQAQGPRFGAQNQKRKRQCHRHIESESQRAGAWVSVP